jgi:hypothetical protein
MVSFGVIAVLGWYLGSDRNAAVIVAWEVPQRQWEVRRDETQLDV